MDKHLYKTVRNASGGVEAILAINKQGNIGISFRNPVETVKQYRKAVEKGKIIASGRADAGTAVSIPQRWFTPFKFNHRRKHSTVQYSDLLEVRLSAIVDEEVVRLRERAVKYFPKG